MLDSTSAQSHYCRRDSLLHPVQRVFVQVSRYATLLSLCATRFQRASTAVAGRSLINYVALFSMDLLSPERLVSRADIGIGIGFIAKILAPEQGAVALVVNRAHNG